MTRMNIPFRPASGDDEIVEQLIQDFDHVQDIANGQLQANTNFKVTAPPSPLDGDANAEGISDSGARADHTHVIRGMERLAAAPTGSHKLGRVFYDTTTDQYKVCTDDVVGTYEAFTNQAAADVAVHGSRHGVGGGDELPDGGVVADMLGRSVQTTNLPNVLSNVQATWVIALSMSQITLPVSQVVTFNGLMLFNNTSGDNGRMAYRILDTDNANVFVAGKYGAYVATATTGGLNISDIKQQAAGNHTYRLELLCQSVTHNGLDVVKLASDVALVNTQDYTSQLSLVVG